MTDHYDRIQHYLRLHRKVRGKQSNPTYIAGFWDTSTKEAVVLTTDDLQALCEEARP